MPQPVNAELGQVSELLMLLASIAYVVALIFFVLDLVRSSKTIGSLEARLAAEQAAPALAGTCPDTRRSPALRARAASSCRRT